MSPQRKATAARVLRSEMSNPAKSEVVSNPLSTLLETIVAALVLIRLLVPPESSVLGGTLWITQAWFAAAMLAVWMHLKTGSLPRPPDLLDAGVFLIVAAHLVSAMHLVWFHDGDRRLAINMAWEWLALGVSFVLLRHVACRNGKRAAWQRLIVSLAVGVASLGLWQHFVGFPAEVRQYQELMQEYDRLNAGAENIEVSPALSEIERQSRLRELRREIARQQIPVEGSARKTFENRLVGSSEPIGFFALANTLAGWLATWMIVGIGMLAAAWSTTWHPRERAFRWLGVGLLGIIAYCLLLTKSRTAWVGTLAGLIVVAALRAKPGLFGRWSRRQALVGVLVACFVLTVVVGTAVWTGGLDRDVVAQSPKSLRYRLQYWSGAIQVLQQHLFWGTGPGNFRSHYLQFKLPEASEEIADPHNLFLDLWTSGGIPAVVGLAITLYAAVRSAIPCDEKTEPEARCQGLPTESGWVIRGGWLGFGALLASLLWTGAESSDVARLLGVAAVWEISLRIFRTAGCHHPAQSAWLGGAAVAMLVHLLGAGGMEMPAVTQTLLLLAVLADNAPVPDSRSQEGILPGRTLLAGLVAVGLFCGCLLMATLPVNSRQYSLAAGDSALSEAGDFRTAERNYRDAAAADPFSPEPIERLSDLLLAVANQSRSGKSSDRFDAAIAMAELARELNPHNPNGYRRVAEFWMARWRATGQATDAENAVRWYEQALERYPNASRLWAAQANAHQAAGNSSAAGKAAARALELDEINQREGHSDKLFEDAVREPLILLRDG